MIGCEDVSKYTQASARMNTCKSKGVCVRACVYACACVRACVCVCARARARVCVCVCVLYVCAKKICDYVMQSYIS
jgi:hypothetical protein